MYRVWRVRGGPPPAGHLDFPALGQARLFILVEKTERWDGWKRWEMSLEAKTDLQSALETHQGSQPKAASHSRGRGEPPAGRYDREEDQEPVGR